MVDEFNKSKSHFDEMFDIFYTCDKDKSWGIIEDVVEHDTFLIENSRAFYTRSLLNRSHVLYCAI